MNVFVCCCLATKVQSCYRLIIGYRMGGANWGSQIVRRGQQLVTLPGLGCILLCSSCTLIKVMYMWPYLHVQYHSDAAYNERVLRTHLRVQANAFVHSSECICTFKRMHLHVQANAFCPIAKYARKERRMRSWVEANAFVGEGKHVHGRRRTCLHMKVNTVHAETNAFARECKTHIRYTLHVSGTVYMCMSCTNVCFNTCELCSVLTLQVRVTHQSSPGGPETTIRDLSTGAFFGEKALLGCVI